MVAVSTLSPTRRPELRLVVARPSAPSYGLRRIAALLAFTFALALAALVADAAFGALSATPEGSARSASAGLNTPAEVHVVQPGDTLWSIAAEIAPDADRRTIVDQLVDLNGTASIQIGERIVLP